MNTLKLVCCLFIGLIIKEEKEVDHPKAQKSCALKARIKLMTRWVLDRKL